MNINVLALHEGTLQNVLDIVTGPSSILCWAGRQSDGLPYSVLVRATHPLLA